MVPSLWALAYHKILITKNRRSKDKREKDMLQAMAILREISKRPHELKKAMSYLDTLPSKWKGYIRQRLAEYMPDLPSWQM